MVERSKEENVIGNDRHGTVCIAINLHKIVVGLYWDKRVNINKSLLSVVGSVFRINLA